MGAFKLCASLEIIFLGKEFMPAWGYSRGSDSSTDPAILQLNYYLILANGSWKQHWLRQRIILMFTTETLLSAETSRSSHALLTFIG